MKNSIYIILYFAAFALCWKDYPVFIAIGTVVLIATLVRMLVGRI